MRAQPPPKPSDVDRFEARLRRERRWKARAFGIFALPLGLLVCVAGVGTATAIIVGVVLGWSYLDDFWDLFEDQGILFIVFGLFASVGLTAAGIGLAQVGWRTLRSGSHLAGTSGEGDSDDALVARGMGWLERLLDRILPPRRG
jgi:hypothetical protein